MPLNHDNAPPLPSLADYGLCIDARHARGRLHTLAVTELIVVGTLFAHIFQLEARSIAEVVALTIEQVGEGALAAALVLAAQVTGHEHHVVCVRALEHHRRAARLRTEAVVAAVRLIDDELVRLAGAIDGPTEAAQQAATLTVARLTVVHKVGRTVVLADHVGGGARLRTVKVFGAAGRVREVAFGRARERRFARLSGVGRQRGLASLGRAEGRRRRTRGTV